MASFSHHQPIDSVFSPNSPLRNSGFSDEFFPNWNQFFNSSTLSLPQPHLEGSSINDASNHESSCLEQQSINNEPSIITEKQSFSSMADRAESGDQVSQTCSSVDKKRKSRNGSSSNSANSKDVKHARGKKHKGDKETKKDGKNDNKDQNKANVEEPRKGYIHVRARRGQATDSHSLAERVRREKISERMKMLQALVPGCDKVTGKALMLDEIINYVQSLQNQVEFLSMRLSSLDPMMYNFGLMDHPHDPIMSFGNQEFMNNNNSMVLPMTPTQTAATVVATSNSTTQPVNIVNPNATTTSMSMSGGTAQPPNFINTNAITTTTTATMASTAFPSLHVIDSSSNLVQLGQKLSVLPIQDDRSLCWGSSGVEDQHRLSFFNLFGFGATN